MKIKPLLFLLLLAALCPVAAKAQTVTETIGTETGTTPTVFPGNVGYRYNVYLYKPSDADFLNSDFDLSSIAFDVYGYNGTIAEYTLWVKDVDANYYMNTEMTFAQHIEGATQVYNTQTAFSLSSGWYPFNFNSNFTHQGGKALLVAMRGVDSNPAGNGYWSSNLCTYTTAFYTCWTLYANDNDPGTNVGSNSQDNYYRPNIQLAVTYSSCVAPSDLAVTYPACEDTEVVLDWTENGEATAWQICLNDNETNLIEAISKPITLTGLTPETVYTAKARAVCGDSHSGWSNNLSFIPTLKTVIGTGSERYPLPFNTLYKYSLTQQIYTAEELGEAATITSIDFYNDNQYSATTRNLQIYMTNTTSNTVSTEWFPVATTDLVFSGSVNFAKQVWTTITLDTPFDYDGTQNIVITVDDNTGGTGEGNSFLCFSTSGQNQTLFYYGNDDFDPTNPNGGGSRLDLKNQIRLATIPQAPVVTVDNVGSSNVTLSWTDPSTTYSCNATPTAWQICINGDMSNLITVTDNPYTLAGLTTETAYTAKVRSIYDAGHTAWSNEVNFTPHTGILVRYRENFDSYSNVNMYLEEMPTSRILPTGWTAINSNTHDAQFPCIVYWGNNPNLWISEPNSLWFYVAPEDNNDIYAILPPMNTEGKQVMMYAGYGGDFTVGLMTDPTDASTFVACSPTYATASDTPRQLILCTLTGQGNYIAVKYSKNASGTSGYIDNVVVFDNAPVTILDPTYAITDNPVSNTLPFDSHAHSYSKQIYTTDELGEAGFITSIGFMKGGD